METERVEIKGKQLLIRRFAKTMIPQFQELFAASFGKSISAEFLLNKYDTAKLGGSYIGHMAFHNEKPVAYYGVLPIPFVLDGKKLTAVQSADTMTHPNYRRHGLFPLLARKTYQLAKDEGASFVFGWPNQNSFPSFKNKLDWIELGNMQRFSLKVSTLPLAKVFFKLQFLRPFYLTTTRSILHADSPTKVETVTTNNCAIRNTDYLEYKKTLSVFSIPSDFGNLPASIDYRLNIGYLTELQTKHFSEILSRLKRSCAISGIDEIQFTISPNSPLAAVLIKAGMKSTDGLPLMYWPFSDAIKIETLNLTSFDYDGF
tara:strand:- start:1302 stop:2249 length:948 start_codon:yes stop_codon:yes gene_type:complete